MEFYSIAQLIVPVVSDWVQKQEAGDGYSAAQHTCRAEMTGLSFVQSILRPRAAISETPMAPAPLTISMWQNTPNFKAYGGGIQSAVGWLVCSTSLGPQQKIWLAVGRHHQRLCHSRVWHPSCVCLFLRAAVTRCYKCGGSKQQKCNLSCLWSLGIWNQGPCSLQSLQGRRRLCIFQLLEAARRSLACGSVTPVSASVFTWPSSWCVCLHGVLISDEDMLKALLLWYESERVTQSCPTPCDPCSPPGSSVHGVSQARMLQWVAVLFSRGSSWPRDWTWVSRITGRFFTIWATLIWPHPNSLHLQWLFFFPNKVTFWVVFGVRFQHIFWGDVIEPQSNWDDSKPGLTGTVD